MICKCHKEGRKMVLFVSLKCFLGYVNVICSKWSKPTWPDCFNLISLLLNAKVFPNLPLIFINGSMWWNWAAFILTVALSRNIHHVVFARGEGWDHTQAAQPFLQQCVLKRPLLAELRKSHWVPLLGHGESPLNLLIAERQALKIFTFSFFF